MDNQDVRIYEKPVPLVKVKGNHRQIGQQIGEEFKDVIQHSIDNAKKLIADAYGQLQLNWAGAVNQSKKYMPFAQERYPKYIEEISGMADGSGVKYYDIAALNALEAVTMDALHLTKCTSMAVDNLHTTNGHVLIAHNEDWLPEDEPDVYLVQAELDDEPAWLAMTYGGLLPNIGLNEAGIAQCTDTVYPSDIRMGVPRVIASRAVLGARNPSEALRNMLIPLRAAGYNHVLAHESGELYNIEVSAKQFAVLYAENGFVAHTNHFLDKKMQTIEVEPDELISTRVRYFRASRLLAQTGKHNEDSLQRILRDHVNYPDSICNHAMDEIDPRDREKTVTSLVMDLNDRKMSVAWGSPCKNKYSAYTLKKIRAI
jgi:isopenicillin-N N-acyltransferase-like protein